MVSRIMISLRKGADPRGDWSLADPATNGPGLKSMKFVTHQGRTGEGQDDTQLDMHLETRSRRTELITEVVRV